MVGREGARGKREKPLARTFGLQKFADEQQPTMARTPFPSCGQARSRKRQMQLYVEVDYVYIRTRKFCLT